MSELTPDQQKLSDLMSELSEEYYCAGWLMGLEYALWEAVIGKRSTFGGSPLEKADIDNLRFFSEKCGGWIYWDDEKGETFAPLDAWKAAFDASEAVKAGFRS